MPYHASDIRHPNFHEIRILLGFAVVGSIGAGVLLADALRPKPGPVPKYHEVIAEGSRVLVLEAPTGTYALFSAGDRQYRLRLESAL